MRFVPIAPIVCVWVLVSSAAQAQDSPPEPPKCYHAWLGESVALAYNEDAFASWGYGGGFGGFWSSPRCHTLGVDIRGFSLDGDIAFSVGARYSHYLGARPAPGAQKGLFANHLYAQVHGVLRARDKEPMGADLFYGVGVEIGFDVSAVGLFASANLIQDPDGGVELIPLAGVRIALAEAILYGAFAAIVSVAKSDD